MAKEILVRDYLSEEMMVAGSALIERLDVDDSLVKVAYWLYFLEDRYWRLFIVSDLVNSDGPRSYYRRVIDANERADADEAVISLRDIHVIGKDLLGFADRIANKTNAIRVSGERAGSGIVDDAYIYPTYVATRSSSAA